MKIIVLENTVEVTKVNCKYLPWRAVCVYFVRSDVDKNELGDRFEAVCYGDTKLKAHVLSVGRAYREGINKLYKD